MRFNAVENWCGLEKVVKVCVVLCCIEAVFLAEVISQSASQLAMSPLYILAHYA